PGQTYFVQVQSRDALTQAGHQELKATTVPDPNPGAPNITIWYGDEQSFGLRGLPQPWINVLGNVSDADGVASITYSLNGAAPVAMSMGPDKKRLAQLGDFNVELDHNALVQGTNIVLLTATDTKGNRCTELVFVDWQGGNVWPLPYSIDW